MLRPLSIPPSPIPRETKLQKDFGLKFTSTARHSIFGHNLPKLSKLARISSEPRLSNPMHLPNDNCFPYLKKSDLSKPNPRALKQKLEIINRIAQSTKSNYFKKYIIMPQMPNMRKTLVLDLDETLIHTSSYETGDIRLSGEPNLHFSIRPYLREFLEFASSRFEVVLFTASTEKYAERIINYIDPFRQYFSFKVYRENCIFCEEGYIKDLRIFQGRRLEDIVIVDNTMLSFAYQLSNGIPIASWYGDKKDSELRKLIEYLKLIENSVDVREINKSNFGLC